MNSFFETLDLAKHHDPDAVEILLRILEPQFIHYSCIHNHYDMDLLEEYHLILFKIIDKFE